MPQESTSESGLKTFTDGADESAKGIPGAGAESATGQDPRVRYQRWDRATEWPMAVIALVFLGVYAYAVVGNLRPSGVSWPEHVMTGVWVIFALHYMVSLVLVKDRVRWFFTHLHELVMVLLPFLRPLQLLRLVKLLSVLHRTAGSALRGQVTVYVAGTSAILVLVAALGVLDAEQNAEGANITTFADAAWWAFVTITTVGYGDYYPITGLGRMIAVGLIIAGIALIGSVTATLASWFVEMVAQDQQVASSAIDLEASTEARRAEPPGAEPVPAEPRPVP